MRPRHLLASVVALLAAVAVLAGCTSGARTGAATPAPTVTVTQTPSGTPAATPSKPKPKPTHTVPTPKPGSGAPVHVSLYEGDGQTYGIAMPIIAYFSAKVTDASSFDLATKVTVNGKPVHGAWYWERSANPDFALEAHYRLPKYWSAHSTINLDLPVKGITAGPGLVFDNSLTLHMLIGAAHLATVNGTPGVDTMTITSDGKPVRTLKVSLGEATTPTYLGIKVVIAKANPQDMVSAPGEPYYNIEVPWSVRVTYDGEFIHDAYWNGEIGQQNLSHGCTNLSPADAQWYYNWSLIGDPVNYVNTGSSQVVPVWDGYGDWNLPWAAYKQGGQLSPKPTA